MLKGALVSLKPILSWSCPTTSGHQSNESGANVPTELSKVHRVHGYCLGPRFYEKRLDRTCLEDTQNNSYFQIWYQREKKLIDWWYPSQKSASLGISIPNMLQPADCTTAELPNRDEKMCHAKACEHHAALDGHKTNLALGGVSSISCELADGGLFA